MDVSLTGHRFWPLWNMTLRRFSSLWGYGTPPRPFGPGILLLVQFPLGSWNPSAPRICSGRDPAPLQVHLTLNPGHQEDPILTRTEAWTEEEDENNTFQVIPGPWTTTPGEKNRVGRSYDQLKVRTVTIFRIFSPVLSSTHIGFKVLLWLA